MNTTYTARAGAFMVAVVMTVAINGAMLWGFDVVAKEASLAQTAQQSTQVTLESVTVVGHRS